MTMSRGLVLCVLVSVSLCLFNVPSVQGAALGIDWGSDFFKASLVKPGSPFQIVENLVSKRKTPNAVSFYHGQRNYGEDALAYKSKDPVHTFSYLSNLLGKSFNESDGSFFARQYMKYKVKEDTERGGFAFEVGDTSYSTEEIVAMLFRHLKDLAKAQARTDIVDAVITVPPFWSQFERQAIIDAAELGGFKVLALIHENTAAAIHYAIDRLDSNRTHNVIFYNMGSSSTKVSLVSYFTMNVTENRKNKSIEAFVVKSHVWDDTLGANEFDLRLVEHFADIYNKQRNGKNGNGFEIRNNGKAMAKMMKEARRTKEILSANREAPMYVEGLSDDIDLRSSITRSDFEQISDDLFQRASSLISKVLADANMTLADVDVVELIGGGIRVPKIQSILEETVKPVPVAQHLNGDECMATGAAFYAANLSTAFRVRKIGMTDVFSFPMGVRLTDLAAAANVDQSGSSMLSSSTEEEKEEKKEEEDGDNKVFSKRATLVSHNNRLNVRKTVAFTHDQDLFCVLSHDDMSLLPKGTSKRVASLNITGISSMANTYAAKLGKPKVALTFLLSASGTTDLVKAEATVEETIMVPVEKEKPKNATAKAANKTSSSTVNQTTSDSNATNVNESTQAEPTKAESTTDNIDSSSGTNTEPTSSGTTSADQAESTPETTPEPAPVEMREKKLIHRVSLQIETEHAFPRPMDSKTMREGRRKLEALDKIDQAIKDTAAAKNHLESFLYSTRELLLADLVQELTADSERQAIGAELEELELWLYEGEGINGKATDYKKKYQAVYKVCEVVFDKLKEHEKKQQIESAMNQSVNGSALNESTINSTLNQSDAEDNSTQAEEEDNGDSTEEPSAESASESTQEEESEGVKEEL